MRRLLVTLLILTALLPAFGTTAEAQSGGGFKRCGDANVVLVFKNPDLQPGPQGIRASGYFFIQFQAIGEDAMKIEKFTFSFGKPVNGADICNTPEYITGAYLKNYRADDEPADGFFVPINTTLVPDGEYAAGVSAYDSSGKELVRYYTTAIVDNGGRTSPRDPLKKDTTMPWPIILPGDGDQTNSVGGLTIEFAEPISYIEARLNGQLLPLEDWTPPARDDDAIPDNPAAPSVVQTRVWGPGYHWGGNIVNDDVIMVRAIDIWGNEAVKVLHIGDPTIGGRIDLGFPNVNYVVDNPNGVANEMGQATYNFTITNTGNGSAHGNIVLERTEGLRSKFAKDHITIYPGDNLTTMLTVTAEQGTQPGTYDVKGYIEYKHGEVEERKPFAVKFTLQAPQQQEVPDEIVDGTKRPAPTVTPTATPTASPQSTDDKGTPGPALGLVALAGVAAALVLRRRA